jgi:hypothetical protein
MFAATIIGDAAEPSLLAERVRDVAGRGRAGEPNAIAQAAIDAAVRSSTSATGRVPACSR